MQSRDFAYWLQGFFELTNTKTINEEQTELIKKHLNLVFKHEIDPSMGDEKHQQVLNTIHHGKKDETSPFSKEEDGGSFWGPQPSEDHVLSSLHGWYNPKEGVPRC